MSPEERQRSVGKDCWSVLPARSMTINFGSRFVSPRSGIVHNRWNSTFSVMSSSYGPAGPFCPTISQSSITICGLVVEHSPVRKSHEIGSLSLFCCDAN